MDKELQDKIRKKEQQLAKVCEEIYLLNMKGQMIQTLPGKIIVRVLPKEHKTEGGLFLPGNVSNKPIYEGIVVAVWKPYWKQSTKKNGTDVWMECPVKIGDRVLFPHFEGVPLSDYLDEKYYRTITDASIYGTLNYQGDSTKVKELKKLMSKFGSVTISGAKSGPGVPDWQPPASADWFTS